MTGAQARRAYRDSSERGKRYETFFCLDPIGIRVGIASPKLLAKLRPRKRAEFSGRVIWVSTANPYFAVRGVRPGTGLATARARLRLGRPFQIGRNSWYLARTGAGTGVLKVRGKVVEEVGIAVKALTAGRQPQRAFLSSFS